MFIEYTAKRSLRSGITAGTTQSFDIEIQADNRRPQPQAKTVNSLSGRHQTIFHRNDITRQLTTVPTKSDAVEAQLIEFLDSVIDGSTFTIDVYGYQASPEDPQTAILSPLNYTPTRVQRLFIQFSFTARML